MASVRWREDRKCWVACYSLPDGRRKQISTGLCEKDQKNEALQVALTLENSGNLAKRGLLSRQRVLALLDEISQAAGARSLVSQMSAKVFLDRYFKSVSVGITESTARRYRSYIDQFVESLGVAASQPMAFIDTMLLSEWRDDRLIAGAAPKTINNQIVFLRSAFREALSQGVIIEDPFPSLSNAKGAKKPIKQPFNRDQLEALLKVTKGEWRMLFLVAYYTGQRERDCRLLEWKSVDFAAGAIHFSRRKNKDVFTAPMHPRLFRHLRWWRLQSEGQVVLPRLAKMKQTGGYSFAHVFRFQILPKIGIVQPYIKGPGRAQSRYSFHSFRHALSSALNESGASEVDRMAIVGHTSQAVNRGYTHTHIEHLRAVLAKV